MRCIALLTLAASAIAIPINQARQGSVVSPALAEVGKITGPVISSIDKGVKRQTSSLSVLGPVINKVTAPVKAAAGPVIANVDTDIAGPLAVVRRQDALVEVTALVKAVVNALVSVLAKAKVDVSALVANVDLSNSSLLDEIADGNAISIRDASSPVVATLADIVALLSALVEAALKANVNVFALLGNVNINYSTILSDLLNDNNVKVLRRDLLDLAAVVKAIVTLVLNVAGYVTADVNAAVANINISHSTIASDILTGNMVKIL
ncbi:hypothetical protein BU17DRAFT_65766 [Hysterangium stoloniferum]|nr:hypothetical protein BU17DRAFT_65766 [Hysterangium stoloniferum]